MISESGNQSSPRFRRAAIRLVRMGGANAAPPGAAVERTATAEACRWIAFVPWRRSLQHELERGQGDRHHLATALRLVVLRGEGQCAS